MPLCLNALVMNDALRLGMAWGENWLKPIQERLALLYPQLSTRDLDDANLVIQELMVRSREHLATPGDREAYAQDLAKRYPWAASEDLGHLYSQAMYYAMK